MAIEIRVPALGESVKEATVGKWFKQPGEAIKADEPLVELETDKVTVEVPAPAAGVMGEINVAQGETVLVGALLGSIREGAAGTLSAVSAPKPVAAALAPKPAAAAATPVSAMPPAPAARRAMAENGVDAATITGSGKRGQVLKQDVMAAIERGAAPAPAAAAVATTAMVAALPTAPTSAPSVTVRSPIPLSDAEREERVRMTRLRQTIARRLKDAQNTAAMLTTFNDVDMSAIMKLRSEYKDLFEKRHGTRLGFMGFFVKACVQALKEVPAVNAEIDGTDIIFKNYYHIGVAVGTEKGLVVPVVRDAELKSLSEIEGTINDYGRKARDGKLTIEDMQGGTFTISNGGVYGSMMSTPILNAPQSGILGMHRIEERPVVRAGQIVIRPMMYLAMSYDHRIVDGKDAVTFLVRVKEGLEDPQRLILEL
jgi:2-oxoglutarate dehydrogenase E2 component (dihydrolipoamide succinyltransferase)